MKIGSFKEYRNSIKGSPYHYLETNTTEFEQAEIKDGLAPSEDEKDIENKKSLLQYLLYANAANQ
jgi:hypothetical protein